MPVMDVRVTLRVASSDHLRPRAMQGSGVAIEATVLDQDGAPIAGAGVNLSLLTPSGWEVQLPGVISDAAGRATAVLAPAEDGRFVARAVVTSPQAEVAERSFDIIAGVVTLNAVPAVLVETPEGDFLVPGTAEPLVMLVDPDGVGLLLPNGLLMGGVVDAG
ncbi:hypothetical protein HB662_02300 [Roseomonas frigidaquae]|uniref:Big-1 domain-containing protein n=1 Tax=Falsiroseomonas frigidaquae TaxID=487318 RepID=A0ABX1ESJ2_9PROT|nr:hypothetical protein [Falsiroseomonas frigidaquae]NKE43591.1 hypothetical protein [Falsiroseomonas frigidaquae]